MPLLFFYGILFLNSSSFFPPSFSHTHGGPSESIYYFSYVGILKTGSLWLDHLSGSISGSDRFSSLSIHWLPVVLHLGVGPCESFPIYTGMLIDFVSQRETMSFLSAGVEFSVDVSHMTSVRLNMFVSIPTFWIFLVGVLQITKACWNLPNAFSGIFR